MKARKWGTYIVLGLIVLGVAVTLKESPMLIIIPVVIFALIAYWYKKPPAFLNRGQQRTYSSYRATTKTSKAKEKRPRSKTVPFKVIDGGRDDNDTPRYH